MKMKYFLVLVLFMAILWSCKKDDPEENLIVVPPQSLSETAAEDDANIREYLQTHFYNYDEFASPPADFDFRIKIDTIAGDNADKTPLLDQMSSKEVSVSSEVFGLEEEETFNHKYYYLEAKEGVGPSPTIADSTYVRYEGSLLNGEVFDGSINIPIWFDLAQIQGPGAARGFAEATANFKSGGEIVVNPDGTFNVADYGVGLMVMPSGLAYFNVARGTIPVYSPLIFTIDVFAMNATDHDRDGIPSILEDVNQDGYLYNDNTDEEQEREFSSSLFANFLDADDDGDTTPTSEEIDIDEDGNVTFRDTDGDGIKDHLDNDN
jgi:FKBP-type peptidyl-prolyl cis-trans isomerase